jgi:hypothetical protein
VVLTAQRLLVAVLALTALAAGAYALGRATGGGATTSAAVRTRPASPRALARSEPLRVPRLQPVGALPDLRSG